MAISTFSDLKTTVAAWINRSDLTSYLNDFVTLAENRIYRTLRVAQMEGSARAVLTAGTGDIALPADHLEMRRIFLMLDPPVALVQTTPEAIVEDYSSTARSQPQRFLVSAKQIQIRPIPDQTYNLEILYYRRLCALSDAEPTNDMLTAYPDLFLYATLIEAANFTGGNQRLGEWTQMYDAAVKDATRSDRRARNRDQTLATDLAPMIGRRNYGHGPWY